MATTLALTALVAVSCWLVLCVVERIARAICHRFVFRPDRRRSRTPADVFLPYEELTLGDPGEPRLRAWWIRSRRPGPAVIFLRGQRGNIGFDLHALRFLARAHLSVLTVDYPGYGRSEGLPTMAGCLRAADLAWEHVTSRRGYAPDRIIVFGRSLGCALAAHLAARGSVAGLVLHSPFTSLVDVIADRVPRRLAKMLCGINFDCIQSVTRCDAPLLVLHDPKDATISIRHAERIIAASPGPRRIVATTGGHHGTDWIANEEVSQALSEIATGAARAWPRVERKESARKTMLVRDG